MVVALIDWRSRIKTMKTTFVVVAMFVLCSAAAFGQVGGSATSVQQLQLEESPQHADYHMMGSERSLIGGSVTSEHGERPLWEFGPVSEPVPLGDVARAYRKEKETAKKAEIVFEKQGS
jgi:hypothetical protein